jgi:ribosome-associated toxin RatA of RatAB toxin-antitoxin module
LEFTKVMPKKLSPRKIKHSPLLIAAFITFSQAITNNALTKETKSCNIEKPPVTEELVNGKSFCVTRVLIKARPEQVWQILSDYGRCAHIFPQLRKCEVLEDRGTTKIAKHVLAPSGIPATYEYILEVHETAPRTMSWHRLSGDFKEVDGFWKLEPTELGHHTLVTYAARVIGGFFEPQPLIKRQFRVDMPNVLLALKTQAEQTTQLAASHRAELSATQ